MTDEPTRHGGLDLRYAADSRVLPRELSERFVRVELGDEGRDYVARALSSRAGRTKTALHRMLRVWMSDFDVNGLLDMYPMHLLGTSQWRDLLGAEAGVRHLDVGAGSGDITRTIAPLVRETVTTETSKVMARNLRKSGFRCHETDVAESGVPEPRYDLVTCLNVIDRCSRPRTLLSQLTSALEPGGRLVLATPFPFDPFVYDGAASLDPVERLDVPKEGWERSVSALVENVIAPLGLEVETVSRVPYLCRGDASQPLYVLDDALLVLRKPGTTGGGASTAALDAGSPRSKPVQSG
jgi:SAM-dependent methyltransferase